MHLQKTVAERRHIGKDATGCFSSDSNPNHNPVFTQIPQTLIQFQPSKTSAAINAAESSNSTKTYDHHFTVEIPQTLISSSAPPKRDSEIAKSSRVDRFRNRASPSLRLSRFSCAFASTLLSLLGLIRFSIPFATKRVLRKLFRYALRARLICFHLRFLLLLSLPPIYIFFVLINLRLLFLFLLLVIVLCFALLVFVHLARYLPFKLSLHRSSSSKSLTKRVVWSIGSKPVSEKKANSGCWVESYSSGDVYEGEFHKGKCSGSGVYYYSMKGRYEGDWIDGKYDGYGVETWAKGSRYRGQYRQGMRHGIGVYRFYTGDVYSGEWSNGQCHGCGVYTSEDGSRYVGEFKWSVKHGLGHYHFRNGDTYAGEYFADKMHGFGVYQFGNGHRYEGAWHEGRRQGLGMYTFRNGETQAGHWENGVLNGTSSHWENGVLNGTTVQNAHPRSPYFVSHSKVLDAVQQARQAAKKAHDVAKVDESVNRAIMAANRAANAARVAAIKAVQKQMHHNSHAGLI